MVEALIAGCLILGASGFTVTLFPSVAAVIGSIVGGLLGLVGIVVFVRVAIHNGLRRRAKLTLCIFTVFSGTLSGAAILELWAEFIKVPDATGFNMGGAVFVAVLFFMSGLVYALTLLAMNILAAITARFTEHMDTTAHAELLEEPAA